MRSTDFPFAVMPQRLQGGGLAVRRYNEGGPSFADRARSVAKGATFAFNDEIEAGLRALAQLDPAAYQREVARIRAQQAAYEEANKAESFGLEMAGAFLPALLPGGQGPAAARMAALAAKAPRAAAALPVAALPVAGEAALYGVGAADSMADIPSSVAEEMLFGLGVYGAGAAAAPRLKALGTKLATKVFPPKAPAKRAPPAKPVLALPAPPPKLKPESYVDLIEEADRRLQGKAARAVSDFVGHEAGTYARGEGSGFGLMMPDALESAFAVKDSDVAKQLAEAFAPVKEQLQALTGPAVKLYRHQGPTAFFGEEPGTRNVLSWTAQPGVAREFAGAQQKPFDLISEEDIARAEEALAREGRASADKWTFVRNPEYPEFADIYAGENDYITDLEVGDLRRYLEDENRYRQELNAAREEKLRNIVEAYVPLDDVVWATNRAGQHEFIVRNRPGAPYAIDKKGRLGGSEFARGGLAVKRKHK